MRNASTYVLEVGLEKLPNVLRMDTDFVEYTVVRLTPCLDGTDLRERMEMAESANRTAGQLASFPYIVESGHELDEHSHRAYSLPIEFGEPSLEVAVPAVPGRYLIAALGADTDVRQLARIYSHLIGADYCAVESLDKVPDVLAVANPRYFAVASLAEQFDDSALWQVEELFWAATRENDAREVFSPGLLVARDLAALSRLLARNLRAAAQPIDQHLQIMPFFQEWSGKKTPHNLHVLQGKRVDAENLAKQTEDAVGILSILAHGTDDATYLGPDVICGASSGAHAVKQSKPYGMPICYHTGQCFKDATLVRASDIPCQIVFSNICMGLKLHDSIFDTAYSLSLNFLDGWAAAYISTPVNKEAWLFENLLFCLLYSEAGWSVGEALSLTNRVMDAATHEPTRLLLVGDPTLRLHGKSKRMPPPRTIAATGSDTWQLALERVGCLAWGQFSDPHLWEAAQAGHLAVQLLAPAPADTTYVGVVPSGDRHHVTIVVFSTSELEQEDLIATLTTTLPVTPPDALRLQRALRSLAPDYPVKVIPEKAIEGRLTQVRNLRIGLAREMSELRFTYGAFDRCRTMQQQLDTQLAAIEDDAVLALAERAESTPFASWDAYDFIRPFRILETTEKLRDASTCTVCGGPLLSKIIGYQLDTSIRRQLDFCYHCGVQRDAPAECQLDIKIEGRAHFSVGEPIVQTVTLRNRSLATMRGAVSLRLGKSKQQRRLVEPALHRYVLPPGESMSSEFHLEFSGAIAPHIHFAKAVAMQDFQLVYSARSIWIEPSRIARP